MSHVEYAPRILLRLQKQGLTDGRTPDRDITFSATDAASIISEDAADATSTDDDDDAAQMLVGVRSCRCLARWRSAAQCWRDRTP